jgi:hypothetical protein
MIMSYVFNDGGRAEAGYKGKTGDCGVRAIAIVAGIPYQEAYDLINEYGKKERNSKNRSKKGKSSARNGTYMTTYKKIMAHLGFTWIPTMGIGTGCKVHLRKEELPMGKIICSVSKHFVAVCDGVIHDTYDSSRNGTRCVYGYFIKK